MDLETYLNTRPYIDNKQALLTSYEFTPISALLSLLGIIAPFTIQPVSLLSFIALCSPLFINFHSYILGGALIMIVMCSSLILGNGEIIIDLILILDGLYIIGSSNKIEKYRMLPSKITN